MGSYPGRTVCPVAGDWVVDESVELSPRHPEAPAWSEAGNKEDWGHRMAVYAAMVDRMD